MDRIVLVVSLVFLTSSSGYAQKSGVRSIEDIKSPYQHQTCRAIHAMVEEWLNSEETPKTDRQIAQEEEILDALTDIKKFYRWFIEKDRENYAKDWELLRGLTRISLSEEYSPERSAAIRRTREKIHRRLLKALYDASLRSPEWKAEGVPQGAGYELDSIKSYKSLKRVNKVAGTEIRLEINFSGYHGWNFGLTIKTGRKEAKFKFLAPNPQNDQEVSWRRHPGTFSDPIIEKEEIAGRKKKAGAESLAILLGAFDVTSCKIYKTTSEYQSISGRIEKAIVSDSRAETLSNKSTKAE